MKKITAFFMLLTLWGVACNKDIGRTVNDPNAPLLSVSVENIEDSTSSGNDLPDEGNPGGNGDGNSEGVEEISGTDQNEHAVYSFLGVSGLYFGCSSSFKSDNETLQFIIGTSKTTNLKFTREEFEQLICTGERFYGSLGAFNTFPERFPNKVEIAYTDKNGRRWCSTRITEKTTNNGIETMVRIEQSRSEFIIDDVHKFE